MHSPMPAMALNVPAAHFTHTEAAPLLVKPMGQGMHLAALMALL